MIEENIKVNVETKVEKWSRECSENGFKFLRKSSENSKCSIAECNVCGHVDSFYQHHMRDGKVRCEQCLIQKYKAAVKHGWEYVDKTVNKTKSYVILKHNCSDNLVTVESGNFLNGKYDCPHCMHSHYDEQSYFYIIKVTNNNNSIIKIGVANNTNRRFRQYGLPDDAILEIVHIEPFPSKRLAITFESAMKQALKEYKVVSDIDKEIFKCQGHTECFTDKSLEYLEKFFNTASE